MGGGLTGLAGVVNVLAVAGTVGRLVVANTVVHAERVVGIVTQHRRTLTSVLVANEGRLTHAEVRYIHEKTHELDMYYICTTCRALHVSRVCTYSLLARCNRR